MINAIIGALIIGLSLGVFGSGGSILTVPTLLYLVNMPAQVAIASSLFIVGGICLVSSSVNIYKRKVSWPHVLLFGIPGMVGTYSGAWLGVMVDSKIQLAVFVLLMSVAAVLMWRGKPKDSLSGAGGEGGELKIIKIGLDGLFVGIITGFVGVGGGFLIVPALIFLGGLSMSLAVGTSLVIIAMQSFSGFFKYYSALSSQNFTFDWWVIGLMIAGGVIGSFSGIWLSGRLPKEKLQKSFSIFLVVMAIVVFTQSVL
ncbi:sulfite exporter TauE/SafE family protein [Paraneptunicella aestuarii]|uniref:sulfite exporter TauE/SafE family protein n=1 Tax=Paraneptunicella aestuarii TaxID=2831148 RepID=UPI001E5B2626|nr:sulfite exporter TauE/SafE family protein [Paraneptunicella aestuarii]UAA38927.1 sulfite exporter TauE/SafE family protein [Paraneptunicella aestuarii]